tara:strand:- start:300 stop:530 length:231 start_codon:yes stop_codon:yes gene_type:complete
MLSITTESSAVNSLELDKEDGLAQVEFSNGNKYTYSNVSKRAIAKLINTPNQSIGQWVNNNLVNADTYFEDGFVVV